MRTAANGAAAANATARAVRVELGAERVAVEGQQHLRRREVAEREREDEHGRGGQPRPGERQRDPPEARERACAERPRRVLERRFELPERRTQRDHREGNEEDRLGEDEQPEAAVQRRGPVRRRIREGDRRRRGRAARTRDTSMRSRTVTAGPRYANRGEGDRQGEHDGDARPPSRSARARSRVAGQRYWRFPLAALRPAWLLLENQSTIAPTGMPTLTASTAASPASTGTGPAEPVARRGAPGALAHARVVGVAAQRRLAEEQDEADGDRGERERGGTRRAEAELVLRVDVGARTSGSGARRRRRTRSACRARRAARRRARRPELRQDGAEEGPRTRSSPSERAVSSSAGSSPRRATATSRKTIG